MPITNTPWPQTGGLYIIWLSDTHYYGGRTKNFRTRWTEHIRLLRKGTHFNPRMQSAWNKYRKFAPLILSEVKSKEDTALAEQAWLDENMGRAGCLNLNDKALTPTMKGKSHSEETIRKMKEAARGRKNSPETRQKMSLAKLGRPGVRIGMTHSYEAKCKMSKGHKGKILTEETKTRMKISQKIRREEERRIKDPNLSLPPSS